MKQHIDTAPVWESYRQDCECPMCLLHARAENANVSYFLGESVMEPSQRAMCVAFCMAVLSPIMAEIGKHLPEGGGKDAA